MICKTEGCENQTQLNDGPKELFNFMIPFTQIEIRVWNWKSKEYNEFCDECLIDFDQEPERDAYYSGFEDGARKVYEENYQ